MIRRNRKIIDPRYRYGYRQDITEWEIMFSLKRTMGKHRCDPGKGYKAPTYYSYQVRNGFYSGYKPCYKWLPEYTTATLIKWGMK